MNRPTRIQIAACVSLAVFSLTLKSEEAKKSPESKTWTRELTDRNQRGTLENRSEKVRGDSGKWRDEARLQLARPIRNKPEKLPLDDWADQLAEKSLNFTAGDEIWLIYRTEQLDDNDRVWVEKVERKGNQLTVILHRATWLGEYSKNFTWFSVTAVNLGKLEPGDYQVRWIEKPFVFQQFEDPPNRRASWPKGEKPAEAEPAISTLTFSLAEP